MKILILLLALAAPCWAFDTNPVPRHLEFQYPTNEVSEGLAVYIYASTNISLSISNWPLIAVVTNLSTNSPTNQIPITLTLPYWFFVGRASNEWGLGNFFSVLSVYPPREDVKMRVRP